MAVETRCYAKYRLHALGGKLSIDSNQDSGFALMGRWRVLADRLPQAVQVDGPQRTVIQPVAWFAGFAPDHAAMVRAHVALKTDVVVGLDDGRHVQRTVAGPVGGFIKRTVRLHLDIAQVAKMDAALAAKFAHQGFNIVAQIGAERARAQVQAVGC